MAMVTAQMSASLDGFFSGPSDVDVFVVTHAPGQPCRERAAPASRSSAGCPQRPAHILRPVHREQDSLEHSLILLTRLILPGGWVSSALPSGRAPFLEPCGQIQPIVEPPVLLRAADSGQELFQLTRQIQCVDGLVRLPFLHVTPLAQR